MSNTVFNAKELEITNTSDTAISMKDFSKFFCDICLIMYNDNKILDIEDYANFTLTNTKINYNNHKQFLITIRNLDLSLLNSFINCEISLNILNSGFIINANFTKISFVECYVENYNYTLNDLEFEEGYTFYFFYLSNSFLYIKNSGFNNSIMKGNLIYFERSSEIEIENSVFMNNLVYLQFFHGYSSILTIKNSRFTENTGANMFLSYCFLEISNSIIENTTLKYTILEYLILSDTSATLYNLSFNNLTIQKLNNFDSVDATYIYVERKNIEIIDCNFKGTEFYIAVYAENVDEINIIRSQFSGFISENYSTLTIINRFYTRVKIVDSVFRENKSFGHGGGLFLKNCDIEINNTTIYSNFANNSGGGIYYTSPVCGFCKFSILGDTKIFNNSCMNQGGGIYWVNYKPYIEKDYLIINNSASYGANIASIPARIGLPNDSSILVSNTISVTNVSPGKIYKKDVVVCLYDTYGQIITTENSIFLTMSSNETTNSNSSVFGTTTFKAKNGFFYLKNFVLSGQPNSDMYLKLQLEGLITTYARNDENNYTNTAIVHIEFRNCTKGEQIQSIACVDCPIGKYTLTASQNCYICPSGATCPGGGSIMVNNGHWRSSLESDKIYTCKVYGACNEGNETNELGSCSTGYSEVLCQSCDLGYSKNSDGKCAKCPSKYSNLLILLFLLLAIVSASVILVKTTLASAFSPKALHSIYIKIFTNYLQLILIVTRFDLEWPAYVTQFYKIQNNVASVSDQIFSIDCFFSNSEGSSKSRFYFIQLGFVVAIPLFIFILSYIYWVFHGYLNNSYRYLKREVYTTMIVLFFLVYPNLVRFLFYNFNCVDIDKMESYLYANTAIECWNSSHKKFSFIFGLPGIILWVIGAPALLFLLMFKRRRQLHLDHNKVIFGFFFNGYKLSKFYWEVLIMFRKILLISILVFMPSQTSTLRALNVIVVLLASLFLHHLMKPYTSNELNKMELLSLFIATLTIYSGLYYLSNSISEGVKISLFVLIVFSNAYFVVYWFYYMAQALIDKFIFIFPQFRLRFKRGDAFDEEFYDEKIVKEGVYFDKVEGEQAYTFLNLKNKIEEKELSYSNMEDAYLDVAKENIKRHYKKNKWNLS